MFRDCVLLDIVEASWRKFSWVFCFIILLTVSEFGVVCLFSRVVPFFASKSAVSFPCIPTCDGIHWKTVVLSWLLRSFISLLASCIIWFVACLYEAIAWMADLEGGQYVVRRI
jgi:hypothetical protein